MHFDENRKEISLCIFGLVASGAWFTYECTKEPFVFPFEPFIGFIPALILLIYYLFFKKNYEVDILENFITGHAKLKQIVGLDAIINIQRYKISQVVGLNNTSNGIKGALIVILDKKLNGIEGELVFQTYDGNITIPKFRSIDFSYCTGDFKQAILIMVDENLNILYFEQLGRETARIDTVYLYENLFKPTFILTIDYSIEFGSYNGPISYFFEIFSNSFTYLFNKKVFMISLKRDWCIANSGSKKEIFYQRTDPICTLDNEIEFNIIYERFIPLNEEWKIERVQELGFWENIQGIRRDEFESKF